MGSRHFGLRENMMTKNNFYYFLGFSNLHVFDSRMMQNYKLNQSEPHLCQGISES